MSPKKSKVRVERDSMGPMEIPYDAYYGASTMRAVINFPLSPLRLSRGFIRALALIKGAAARVNVELGLLDASTGDAIWDAAMEVAQGVFDDQFVVDVFQTGSGTSTNMNANEVIANRAAEILGAKKGSRTVHSNDHVNLCQSSNDVIPTAIHLAALIGIKEKLTPSLEHLHATLEDKSREFWPIITTGRTHGQDATPIRLGQAFWGYAGQIERCIHRIKQTQEQLSEVALGGTAVGTGVNSHKLFASKACALISQEAQVHIKETTNHFQAQSTLDAVVATSGAIRTVAISVHKIANDIRWLGSGPRAGLGELALPEVQPGSSIMPGKVNPVIVESLIQASAQIISYDLAVCQAGLGSHFQLNTMLPLAAHNLLASIDLMANSCVNFGDQCIVGIQSTGRGPRLVEEGLMLGTALAPVLGYDKASEIAKEAAVTGTTIRDIAMKRTDLSPKDLDTILDPEKMTEPGLS